ncbi:hypothetical protein BgAZ_204440 [Babesia gibsoni]|uniref:U6 snRNA-associated Sm-like protein LSm1 n=1 Tax=Babesia gibsoni TaxID=33632 RepID=A0AAD8PDM2_BABGI|nr:hypothetical protein BgAZ_204440 [Babesia gibsoni]
MSALDSSSPSDHLNKSQWIWVVEDELGSLIWVSLRDETHYVGIFKSFDQYGNIMLTDTVKKLVVNSKRMFSDVYCGNMIIRGESIAYFCAIDVEAYLKTFKYDAKFDVSRLRQIARKRNVKAASPPTSTPLTYVDIAEALKFLKEEQDSQVSKQRTLNEMLGCDPF